jgi:hypothetical protein
MTTNRDAAFDIGTVGANLQGAGARQIDALRFIRAE